VRRVAVRVLQKHGLVVSDAADVDDALAVYSARSGDAPIQLLLTDLVMPGANGRTLARILRSRDSDLRVVYMSGYEADTFTDEPDAPVGGFLAKPFTETALLGAVRNAVSSVPTGA
jgi:DNA-binding NtrC family response regulator